jgi:hypothetical protein
MRVPINGTRRQRIALYATSATTFTRDSERERFGQMHFAKEARQLLRFQRMFRLCAWKTDFARLTLSAYKPPLGTKLGTVNSLGDGMGILAAAAEIVQNKRLQVGCLTAVGGGSDAAAPSALFHSNMC